MTGSNDKGDCTMTEFTAEEYLDSYQDWVEEMSMFRTEQAQAYPIVGVAAEAGEVLEILQKRLRKMPNRVYEATEKALKYLEREQDVDLARSVLYDLQVDICHILTDADKEKLFDEMGDVLFYIAALCNTLDVAITDVLEHNVQKLTVRRREKEKSK